MQKVHAVNSLALLAALGTRQLDLHDGEEGESRGLILEPDQPGVEVDLRRQGGNADEGGCTNDHQRSDGLVEEARINVGCFLA